MLALTMVVLLQVSVPSTVETREKLMEGVRGLESALDEFETIITRRLSEHAAKPHTGLRSESAEAVGSDNLHALTVVSVIPDGPADVAGIRTGDRIIAIGLRSITHESSEIAEGLLNNGSGVLSLEIERDCERRSASIARSPLPCLQKAVDDIDEATWLALVSKFRVANALLREWLDETPDRTLTQLYELNKRYQQLLSIFEQSVRMFQNHVGFLTAEACSVAS